MEYNTTRSNLILREYGRNFHKLVDHIKGIKEKEKRNELSKTLVDMMKVTQVLVIKVKLKQNYGMIYLSCLIILLI